MSGSEVRADVASGAGTADEKEHLSYYREELSKLASEIRSKVSERRRTGKIQRVGSWIAGGVVGAASVATGVTVLSAAGIPDQTAGLILLVTGGLTALSPALPLGRGKLNLVSALDLEAVAREAEEGVATCSNAAEARELNKVLQDRRAAIERIRI